MIWWLYSESEIIIPAIKAPIARVNPILCEIQPVIRIIKITERVSCSLFPVCAIHANILGTINFDRKNIATTAAID